MCTGSRSRNRLELEKDKEKLDLSFLEVFSVDPKVLEKIAMEVKKLINKQT
jgi:hypothetical protein